MKKGIDEGKVFEALRNCITEPKCRDCPWEECEQFDCKKTEIPVHLGLDILELLKEQEPVVPIREGGQLVWWYACGECHTPISPNFKCCPQCERPIKWESK